MMNMIKSFTKIFEYGINMNLFINLLCIFILQTDNVNGVHDFLWDTTLPSGN